MRVRAGYRALRAQAGTARRRAVTLTGLRLTRTFRTTGASRTTGLIETIGITGFICLAAAFTLLTAVTGPLTALAGFAPLMPRGPRLVPAVALVAPVLGRPVCRARVGHRFRLVHPSTRLGRVESRARYDRPVPLLGAGEGRSQQRRTALASPSEDLAHLRSSFR